MCLTPPSRRTRERHGSSSPLARGSGGADREVTIYIVAQRPASAPFDSVFVEITPKSHRVYRITAVGLHLTDDQLAELRISMVEKHKPMNGSITWRVVQETDM